MCSEADFLIFLMAKVNGNSFNLLNRYLSKSKNCWQFNFGNDCRKKRSKNNKNENIIDQN